MKVLVLAHCVHRAYVEYLRAAHPSWDVRSVLPAKSEKWLEEGRENYKAFLSELDILVGVPEQNATKQWVNPAARRVRVPPFSFFGNQSDMCFVPGIASPLDEGIGHSRIGAEAWLSGRTTDEAASLFTAENYARLGYFDQRDSLIENLNRVFRGHGQFDTTDLLNRWINSPGLFWTPSHPRVSFLFELLRLAMTEAGFAPDVDDAKLDAARDAMHDYLGDGVHWPVYPEIAAHHGIAAEPSVWRSSAAKGDGKEFGLAEMLERSYAIYDADPDKARLALRKTLTANADADDVVRHAAGG